MISIDTMDRGNGRSLMTPSQDMANGFLNIKGQKLTTPRDKRGNTQKNFIDLNPILFEYCLMSMEIILIMIVICNDFRYFIKGQ